LGGGGGRSARAVVIIGCYASFVGRAAVGGSRVALYGSVLVLIAPPSSSPALWVPRC